MSRYFLEVCYKGSEYSGFQKQDNANTIQAEVEKALAMVLRRDVELTGSSRTDAGVHARQNFFHFDFAAELSSQLLYKINALLPFDISAIDMYAVRDDAHCRFDARSRFYQYFIHQSKDPFLQDRAYYYPYKIELDSLNEAASVYLEYDDFRTFSKRNTQDKHFICNIEQSEWVMENKCLIYRVRANRFLRGMVRGLTGTMLQVARGKISIEALRKIIEGKDCSKADFAVPAKGLFLEEVIFSPSILKEKPVI